MTRLFLGFTATLALCWSVYALGAILDPPAVWHASATVAHVLKIRS